MPAIARRTAARTRFIKACAKTMQKVSADDYDDGSLSACDDEESERISSPAGGQPSLTSPSSTWPHPPQRTSSQTANARSLCWTMNVEMAARFASASMTIRCLSAEPGRRSSNESK